MMKFTRMLPAFLKRTNVVLEIRDSRLPLTSINRTLEGKRAAYLPFLLVAPYSGPAIEMNTG
jgi:ribosome biogenesis GTPase A